MSRLAPPANDVPRERAVATASARSDFADSDSTGAISFSSNAVPAVALRHLFRGRSNATNAGNPVKRSNGLLVIGPGLRGGRPELFFDVVRRFQSWFVC